MSPFVCILVPIAGAFLLLTSIGKRNAITVLISTAVINALAVVCILLFFSSSGTEYFFHRYFVNDSSSRLFLTLIISVFLGFAPYVYVRVSASELLETGINKFGCLSLLFFTSGGLAVLSNHLILNWLFLELTTIAAAPMIYHQKTGSSVRAAWKYFLFSNVGLGIVFLGFICLMHAFEAQSTSEVTLFISELSQRTDLVSSLWTKLGIFLVLLGYGTKLGMAPMYAWLPDTYDAAPPSVTSLLAAVQFNCVVLAVFRVLHLFRDVDPDLVRYQLIAMGLLSVAIATINVVTAKNFKKLIAYASINHAGVIAIGLGLGRTAAYGVVVYVLSNALVKAILFLTAGNIKARYRTKSITGLQGLIHDMPYSGWSFMVGIFALLGFAPFGSFLGEIMMMSAMIEQGRFVVFCVFCMLMTFIFIATGRSLFPMIWGESKVSEAHRGESILTVIPNFFFVVLLMVLGLYIPLAANQVLQEVALQVAGK